MNRERWIDNARGWAIILVVIGHMGIPYFGQYFTTCHLPLFFFLSGILFTTKESFANFLHGKIKHLLVPYLFLGLVLIINSIITRYVEGTLSFGSVENLLCRFLLQEKMYTIWFLTCLFFVNLFFYVLVKITSNRLGYLATLTVIMWIVGVTYYRRGGVDLPYNIDASFTAMPYFFCGYLLKTKVFVKTIPCQSIWLMAFTLLCYISLVAINWHTCHEKLDMATNHYGLAPLTMIAAFLGILFFVIISHKWHILPVEYIGKNSLIFFGWHQSIVLPLLLGLYETLGLFTEDNVISDAIRTGVTVILVFVALYPFDRLIGHTRLKFLLGKF